MPAAIRDATRDDLPTLRNLLARANDTPYDLVRVAEEKCFGEGIAGTPAVRMIEDLGVAVTCGKWLRILAVAPDARRRGIGSALLEDAESRGAHVVFAEPGNYFTPGVLASDEGTLAFFAKHGYRERAATTNLVASAGQPGNRAAGQPPSPRALAFIEQHFGRIWAFESARAQAIYTTEDDGNITGFATIEANNRNLGTFGPTGVAKDHRGKGLGTILLHAALNGLRDLGYDRVTIPWTDALGFYSKACGAEAAHRFVALDSEP